MIRRLSNSLPFVFVLAFFAMSFLVRCANPASPQGGPVDSLPPVVLAINPDNYQTRFNQKRITVTFDEYVQLKDIQNELMVSPPMERKPTVTVKGRGIVIDIRSELDTATTYRLDFGDGIRDNNEGNILRGFSYVFSTGDYIDSLVMSGQVIDGFSGDSIFNALVLFYDAKADTMAYDSLVYNSKILAIARTDSSGLFIAENLKDMDYRVYAIADENRNGSYEPETDQVAFLDTIVNPVTMPSFKVWYDTASRRLSVTPQIRLRTFGERAVRRQNLSSSTRPLSRKIELTFADQNPEIVSLNFEGLDTATMIRQRSTYGDTLVFWLTQPAENLPDTVYGEITYLSQDSIGQPAPVTRRLSLARPFVAPTRARDKEQEEETNPFQIRVDASSSINPEKNIAMVFQYPLLSIDSARIVLEKTVEPRTTVRGRTASPAEQGEQEVRLVPVPVHVIPDSSDLLKWYLTAPWENDTKYNLLIPAGVFTNYEGEQNDTLSASFTTFNPDKFGTLIADVQGNSDSTYYIVSLVDKNGREIETKTHIRSGKHTFNFVNAGDYKFRIIQDMNGNGIWDSGDLIGRIHPERVANVINTDGRTLIQAKAGWEIELIIDVSRLFLPLDPYGQTIDAQPARQTVLPEDEDMEEEEEEEEEDPETEQNTVETTEETVTEDGTETVSRPPSITGSSNGNRHPATGDLLLPESINVHSEIKDEK